MMIMGLDICREIELKNRPFGIAATIGWPVVIAAIIIVSWLDSRQAIAQEAPSREELKQKAEETFGEPKNATRLSKDGRIWIDKPRKLVIVDGFVTLREGQLEMFACPVGTKEHESIVAVFSSAQHVHAGLLAIGAKQGSPTEFEPYKPATGATIKIHVLWRDNKNQKQNKLAQHWIRDVEKNKEMPYDWVFAGSILYKDPDTGEENYLGNNGDLICVANFPTATLDIAIQSMSSNSGLSYSAYTERIPPHFTVVRLVLEISDQAPNQSADGVKKPQDQTEKAKESETDKANFFNPSR